WASVYAQCARMLAVRAQHPRWGTPDYTGRRLAAAFDYHAALRPWAKALGHDRIKLRPYDRSVFPGGDGVRDFLAIATPAGTVPFEPEGKDLHRSFGWKGVALAIACNDRLRSAVEKPAAGLLDRHRRAVVKVVNAMARRHGEEGWYGRAPSIFDLAEREAVRAHYARSNARLTETYALDEPFFAPPAPTVRDPLSLFALPDTEREDAFETLIRTINAAPRRGRVSSTPARPSSQESAPDPVSDATAV
ncbi:MAG: hypothetical protein AAFT19_10255, partial [Pseudomonadota bacterium]